MGKKENQKNIYIKPELWDTAKAKSVFKMSQLIRILLQAFVDGDIVIGIDGKVTCDRN